MVSLFFETVLQLALRCTPTWRNLIISLLSWHTPFCAVPTIWTSSPPAAHHWQTLNYPASFQAMPLDLRGAFPASRIRAPATLQSLQRVFSPFSPAPRKSYFLVVLLAPDQFKCITLQRLANHFLDQFVTFRSLTDHASRLYGVLPPHTPTPRRCIKCLAALYSGC